MGNFYYVLVSSDEYDLYFAMGYRPAIWSEDVIIAYARYVLNEVEAEL